MAKIELRGNIEKIVRIDGKSEAQMLVTIPVAHASSLPTGKVSITIESLQTSMFPGASVKITGGKEGEPARSTRGRQTAGTRA